MRGTGFKLQFGLGTRPVPATQGIHTILLQPQAIMNDVSNLRKLLQNRNPIHNCDTAAVLFRFSIARQSHA
mgnify:CR=1 FL=1